MKNRNVLNSPRLQELKKRRERAFLKRATVYVLGFAVILAGFTYLSSLSGLNIATVEAEGNTIVDTEAIRAAAERELNGKYLWLFPKTNILFYPKNKIAEALGRELPRLGEIELAVKNDRVLLVSVTEREPAYTWCGEKLEEPLEQCYFMDEHGYIFDAAPYFSGDVYFKFFGNLDKNEPLGAQFANGLFENLNYFRKSLETFEIRPVALYLRADGDADIYLQSAKNPEPKIIFRATDDGAKLSENLSAALETEPLRTRMNKEYHKLMYLDLRFDNKVFSKFSQ